MSSDGFVEDDRGEDWMEMFRCDLLRRPFTCLYRMFVEERHRQYSEWSMSAALGLQFEVCL